MDLELWQQCKELSEQKFNGILELTKDKDLYRCFLGLSIVGEGSTEDEAMRRAIIKAESINGDLDNTKGGAET